MSKSVKVATIAINQTVEIGTAISIITQAILQGRSQGIKLLLFRKCVSQDILWEIGC